MRAMMKLQPVVDFATFSVAAFATPALLLTCTVMQLGHLAPV
jgi:hypothetical protein